MKRGDDPSRLADNPGLDGWLVNLLHGTAPYKSPPGRKQRVLLSLGRPMGGRAPLVLRMAIVAGVVIACGALATAAIGPWRGWMGRTYARLAPPATAPITAAPRARESAPAAPLPITSVPRTVAAAPSTLPTVVARREGASPSHARRNPPLVPVTPPVHGPVEEDPQMVVAGMRALRSEGNPVRARGLLAQYLERHPEGTLAEEALALTIEAAIAHRDADAAALGARYLRQYPTGRFTALALRAQR